MGQIWREHHRLAQNIPRDVNMNDLILYNALRNDIKTGDFLSWDTSSALGETIQVFNGSDDNHGCLVDRLTGLAGDRIFSLEALGGPFRPYYLSLRLKQFKGKVYWHALCDEWDMTEIRKEIEFRMWSHVGIGYDYPALFKNAIRKVKADPKLLFCYEEAFISLGFSGEVPVNRHEFEALKIFKDPIRIL
jgi:hypothetical protein